MQPQHCKIVGSFVNCLVNDKLFIDVIAYEK